MMSDNATLPILQKLIEDDAVGQLRRRDGLMARLGSEDGVLKLDWVEGVARLLADPTKLEEVEVYPSYYLGCDGWLGHCCTCSARSRLLWRIC